MAKNNWTARVFRHFQRSRRRSSLGTKEKNLLGLHPKIGGTPAGRRPKVPEIEVFAVFRRF